MGKFPNNPVFFFEWFRGTAAGVSRHSEVGFRGAEILKFHRNSEISSKFWKKLGDGVDLLGDGVDLLVDGVDLLGEGVDLLGEGVDLLGDGVDLLGDGGDPRSIAGGVIKDNCCTEMFRGD